MVKEILEHSRIKMTFDVTADEFEKALDVSFKKNNANVTLKGFRKGHATRAMFEKTYGVEALYEDALNEIFNNKVKEVLEDKELVSTFVGEFIPNVEGDEKLERGKDFKVSLSMDVYPEVNLPQYKGVKVKKADTTVTETEVKDAIDMLLRPKAEKVKKAEQVLALNDYAVFDFKGFVGEEAFEGGEAQNYELKIGSHQFIPGFEDQMIGMKAGETKDVNVTFPAEYGAEHLAGKDARFVVTLHEVKEEIMPELNDEFVAGLKIDGVNTVEELKAHKTKELTERKTTAEKDRQVDQIINNILDNAVVDMPEAMNERKVNALRNQYESQAKMYNIPFDTFLQLIGTNKEKFEADILNQGKRQALFDVVFTKLLEVENLGPNKETVDAKLAEELKDKKPTQNDYLRVYSNIAYENAVKFLLDNAEYTE